MASYVQDIWGGFAMVDPPIDNGITLRFQSFTHPPRLAVGADVSRVYFAFGAEADQLFEANDVIAIYNSSVPAFDRLSEIFAGDTTYNFLGFPVHYGGGQPVTVVPSDGMTVTPADGFTLSFRPNWFLVWFLKTGDGTYTLNGDLEAA